MKIGLLGYGRMGKVIESLSEELDHEVVVVFDEYRPFRSDEEHRGAEVLIDFSTADAVMRNLREAASRSIAVVEGTTGWNDQLQQIRRIDNLTMIHSPNFSMGVYQFMKIVGEAARRFGDLDQYDVYVHEWHHRGKSDSPSGTALRLGEVVTSSMDQKTKTLTETCSRRIQSNELHVTSTRVGRIPGTHEVGFDSPADSILLRHMAHGREGFALGAIRAAEWIVQRKGVFTMDDFMESLSS